jgi:hypothetical protein
MRILVLLLAIVGGIILVGMTIAPNQPPVRDWYIANACPYLDMMSTDICAPVRRATGERGL